MNIDALRARQIPLSDPARAAVPFHLLVKPVGAGCNLACRYCYYPQRGERPRPMDDALLEAFIRRYIAAQPRYSREINFVWQGANRCWRASASTSGRWRCSAAMRRRA
ncbi:hypothetical protein GGER_06060 [Serratia rubidaea]